jgi:hypothetical protein
VGSLQVVVSGAFVLNHHGEMIFFFVSLFASDLAIGIFQISKCLPNLWH